MTSQLHNELSRAYSQDVFRATRRHAGAHLRIDERPRRGIASTGRTLLAVARSAMRPVTPRPA